MKNFSINKLIEFQGSKKLNSIDQKLIDILLAAINDWPDLIINLENYESEVAAFIGGETTKQKIKVAERKFDISKDAWKAESLSQIMELFDLYDTNISLKEIIRNFEIKLNEEKLV